MQTLRSLHVQTLMDDLEDASNELMLADEEEVRDSQCGQSTDSLLSAPPLCIVLLINTHLTMPVLERTVEVQPLVRSQRAQVLTRQPSGITLVLQESISVQVRYSVGDCFYHAAPDEAEEKLQGGD